MAAEQAPTAWGRCLGCGAEGHLDARTGLCPACQARMPAAPVYPAARPAVPPDQPVLPGQASAPDPYQGFSQVTYQGAAPGAAPGGRPGAYPYQGPYPGAEPHPYPYTAYPAYPAYPTYPAYPAYYTNPYAWSYPYPTKSPQQQGAETRAVLGAVLCLIGLTIVFPFGFVTAPMGAIGLALCYSAYREGVQWAIWGIVFAIAVIMLGIIGVIALLTIPPIW